MTRDNRVYAHLPEDDYDPNLSRLDRLDGLGKPIPVSPEPDHSIREGVLVVVVLVAVLVAVGLFATGVIPVDPNWNDRLERRMRIPGHIVAVLIGGSAIAMLVAYLIGGAL